MAVSLPRAITVFFYDLKSASGKRIDYGFAVVDCFFGAQDELRPFLATMGMVWIVNMGLMDGEGQEVDQCLFFGCSHIGRIAPPYRRAKLPGMLRRIAANIAKLPELLRKS